MVKPNENSHGLSQAMILLVVGPTIMPPVPMFLLYRLAANTTLMVVAVKRKV